MVLGGVAWRGKRERERATKMKWVGRMLFHFKMDSEKSEPNGLP